MAEDKKAQKKCFGTIWIGPKEPKRGNKRSSKDLKELFEEHCEELNELIETGACLQRCEQKNVEDKGASIYGGP